MVVVYKLTTEDKPSRAEIGGKAYGLMQAIEFGFPVPDGFVLPVSFFDSWFRTIHTYLEYEQYVKDPTPAVCADLQEKVRLLRFDPEQKRVVDDYWLKEGLDGLSAVRSS